MKQFVFVILAGLGLLAGSATAKTCELKIAGTDMMKFDKTELTVESGCKRIKLVLTHSGKLPKAAMGHNWVLSKTSDMADLAGKAIAAGLAAEYVPKDDRVIAATKLVGGGESTTVEFDNKLKAGGDYSFFCSFPGHSALMKGKLIVK